MIIACTMRLAPAINYYEPRDAISHDLIRYLEAVGVTPVPIPNSLANPREFVARLGVRGIVLTGGNSIARSDSAIRDAFESELLTYATDCSIPVFGICRGLQMINLYFGGNYERNLAERVPFERHVAESHSVQLVDGHQLTVNSFHDEGVLVGQLAEPLSEIARSPAGVVEAVRHRTLPIVAVQWHPERQNGSASGFDRSLIENWLHRCAS